MPALARSLRCAAALFSAFAMCFVGPVLGSAGGPPPAPAAVTVSQAAALSSPQTVELDSGGELRVISFPDAIVSSVVVAKPWILARPIIQAHDVILQANASSGDMQLIIYADGAGTLWNVVIGPHKPAPARILVSSIPADPATPMNAPTAGRSTGPGTLSGARSGSKLTAFLGSLDPEQRAPFDAWQRDPTMERLAAFLITISTSQRAEFQALASAGQVSVPQAIAAPTLVQRTTVLSPQDGAREPSTATAPPLVPPLAGPPPLQTAALYVYQNNVPKGLTVTATADPAGEAVAVRYAIHNGLPVWLQRARASATDGRGAHVDVPLGGPSEVAPGGDTHGTLMVPASALPVTIAWTWAKAAASRLPLIGVEFRTEQDMIRFYLLVTP